MNIPANSDDDSAPSLVIVMGASGAGKSTVSQALAERCGYVYLDADDFHSAEARAHMAAGKPLTDAMRVPWVEAICQHLRKLAADGTDVVRSEERRVGKKRWHTRWPRDWSSDVCSSDLGGRKIHCFPGTG